MKFDVEWLAGNFPQLSAITPLKHGGQKWVFSCECSRRGACVLKLLKPGASGYLDREFEAVKRVSSQNVPSIFESGVVDSQTGSLVWLLEERVDGEDLSTLLKQGPLSREQILALALHLTSAARDAEAVLVVHRDIKPANIIIDTSGKAWLLDFGIARILDLKSKTKDGALVGPHSPGYSAPEQFRYQKRKIDGRSDLFAIGVVLYESATGVNPFIYGARDRVEILRRVERQMLPQLKLPWDTKDEFGDFVSACAQKSPHQRPSNCEEALEWLGEIVGKLEG